MSERPPLFSGETFERLIALLIASVALLAAVTAYLEADAGSRSDLALRDAQQYGIQAVGTRTRGEIEIGYALTDAFRLWLELDAQALLATETAAADEARLYADVRDVIATLSPMLQEPYFTAERGGLPDINAYEADRYLVQATLLGEQYANAGAVAEAWDGKAQRYVTHLTLLTVTLFLYGLATTVSERVGTWFTGLGTVIATTTLIWVIFVVLEPVPVVAQEAMAAYAEGVGLRHQDSDADAVAAFDEALAYAPDYGNAFYQRARARFDLRQYEQSAADYVAAGENGREDVNVPWNLGWTLYIGGDLDGALEQTERAIDMAPDQVALHFNRGLMALALGERAAAVAAYEHGAAVAMAQVVTARAAGEQPPATLWWYLGQAAADLDNLQRCLADEQCSDAPPYESVQAVAAEIEETRQTLEEQLKSLAIVLEYDVAPPNPTADHAIDNLSFAEAVYDDSGAISAYQPLFSDVALRGAGTFEDQGELADVNIARTLEEAPGEIFMMFDYEKLNDEQLLIAKVYESGREIPGLRLVEPWRFGESGAAILPLISGRSLTLTPGSYSVELYVDAEFAGVADFIIGAP